MKRPLLLAEAMAFALALRCAGADPFDTWTWRNPLPTGNNLNAVTFGMVIAGNTNFVAVGDAGTILTSANGSNWVTRVSGTNAALLGVTYGLDALGHPRLVAVGRDRPTGSGVILTSADGVNWRSQSSGSAPVLNAVIQGADASGAPLLVAVGGAGSILVSSDGSNWTARTPATANALLSVAFGNVGGHNTFVAVGDNGTTVTSMDGGANWATNAYISPDIFYAVTFAENGFVLVGSWSGAVGNPSATFTSSDGLIWKPRPSNTVNSLTALAFGDAEVVAVGLNGTTSTSPDAKAWTVNTNGVFGINLHGVAFGNHTFVAVGDGGASFTSTDGANWIIARFRAVIAPLTGVAFGNNTFVVIGGKPNAFGVVLTSPDGLFWTHQLSVSNTYLAGIAFGTNAAGAGLFVAVGNDVPSKAATILTSTDGATWAAHAIGTNLLYAVTCGRSASGPLFVAVGSAGIAATSADGINWATHLTARSFDLSGVAWGGGRFMAVGAGPNEISLDGTNWSNGNTSLEGATGVTFGHGQFAVVTGVGAVYTSPDGTNWTLSFFDDTGGFAPKAITCADGEFVAVGRQVRGAATLVTSADGTNWIARDSGVAADLTAIGFGAGRARQFIAVGNDDTILGCTLSVSLPFSYSPGSGVQISVTNLPFGRAIVFQSSRDLVQWSPLTNVVLGRLAPTAVVRDPSAVNFVQGFYSLGIR